MDGSYDGSSWLGDMLDSDHDGHIDPLAFSSLLVLGAGISEIAREERRRDRESWEDDFDDDDDPWL